MDGGRGFGGSDILALLDNPNHPIWFPSFHESMMNFDPLEGQQGLMRSPKADRHRGSEGEEELEMSNNAHPEKKRRLTAEQVELLEKNFEKENKLEADKKVELARELGLEPRQVAIWFQNRRARYKTKQLEKEYDTLKASYDQLKINYDSLIKEKECLQNEVKLLTKKLKLRESGQANLGPDSLDDALHSEPHQMGKPRSKTGKLQKMGQPSNTKQAEDNTSAKSDVLDSESPNCTEGNHPSHLEDPVDSILVVDPDLQSDFSQDEEDPQLTGLLPAAPAFNDFLKVFDQEGCYGPNISATCNFSLVDDQPFWSWLD